MAHPNRKTDPRHRRNRHRTARFEEIRRQVAGIDLAGRADHYVCGPRKEDGTHDIARFGTTTGELHRMAAWLRERRVESVAMESTGVYWIPVYDTLERAGFEVLLVDTRDVRMVPGRKSDVQDCQWIQRLHSCGLLHGAFRPPAEFNAVRTVIRERTNVREARTQTLQSIQKSMDQMNIRLHHAVSDIDGATGMRILAAIVAGERDPHALARLRDWRCRKSEAEIAEELTGTWNDEHLFNLSRAYERLCFLDRQLEAYDRRIRAMYAQIAARRPAPPPPEPPSPSPKDRENADAKADLARICGGFDMTQIPGIAYDTAAALLAETGADLAAFPSERHFVAYSRLAPRLSKSAGKPSRGGRRGHDTPRTGQLLRMAASTLRRSGSYLGGRYRCVAGRAGSAAAVKDVARLMAKLVYRGLKHGQPYVEEGERTYLLRRRERTVRTMKRNMARYGITPEELGLAPPSNLPAGV